jgi:predicted nucleic acid-binding Zn ribbon protein
VSRQHRSVKVDKCTAAVKWRELLGKTKGTKTAEHVFPLPHHHQQLRFPRGVDSQPGAALAQNALGGLEGKHR